MANRLDIAAILVQIDAIDLKILLARSKPVVEIAVRMLLVSLSDRKTDTIGAVLSGRGVHIITPLAPGATNVSATLYWACGIALTLALLHLVVALRQSPIGCINKTNGG